MHILTLTEPVNLGKSLGELGAGEWVVTDQNGFEIANMAARGTARLREFISSAPLKAYQGGPSSDDRHTLIMRTGAIGDLLMLTPVLREWFLQTNQWVTLCCFPKHFPLFEGHTSIGKLVPYPLSLSSVPEFRQIISLENTMERDHTRHPTDIFFDALGLTKINRSEPDTGRVCIANRDSPIPEPPMGYKPIYHVKPSERLATSVHLFTNRPNIVLQLRASVANRDYPLPHWLEVIQALERRGWGVLLLGAKGQLPPLPPHIKTPFIRDLSVLDLSLRESAAVLSQCDALIGIDSAFLHFAHALDIPAIGLFGPFDWKVRVGAGARTRAISGEGACKGCSWHRHNGNVYPPNKPCSTARHCVVLASIEPARVVAAAELLKPKIPA